MVVQRVGSADVQVFQNLRFAQLIYDSGTIYVLGFVSPFTPGQLLGPQTEGTPDDIVFRRGVNSDFPHSELMSYMLRCIRDGKYLLAACIAATLAAKYYTDSTSREAVNYLMSRVVDDEALLDSRALEVADIVLQNGYEGTYAEIRSTQANLNRILASQTP